jgi:hypothetical protein
VDAGKAMLNPAILPHKDAMEQSGFPAYVLRDSNICAVDSSQFARPVWS